MPLDFNGQERYTHCSKDSASRTFFYHFASALGFHAAAAAVSGSFAGACKVTQCEGGITANGIVSPIVS